MKFESKLLVLVRNVQKLTHMLFYDRPTKPGTNLISIDPRTKMTSSNGHDNVPIASQSDSKLELFGFDSLVNILGLKRYDNLRS